MLVGPLVTRAPSRARVEPAGVSAWLLGLAVGSVEMLLAQMLVQGDGWTVKLEVKVKISDKVCKGSWS